MRKPLLDLGTLIEIKDDVEYTLKGFDVSPCQIPNETVIYLNKDFENYSKKMLTYGQLKSMIRELS